MKVYHQTGFRYNWNIDVLAEGIGEGIIYSPINIDADKLLGIKQDLKKTGFLDPQLYLLNAAKGTLDTYPYFPGNLSADFSTPDLDDSQNKLAQLCIDYQVKNDFEYIVIPTRHYADYPTNYFIQSTEYFVSPFCEYLKEKGIKKQVLLSVIVKSITLSDPEKRSEMLNWITSHQNIHGVYLIFENNFTSKQIKDFDYLLNALRFIKVLKENNLEVHIGYNNTEGLLYSIAMPDSVSIGSYENLRRFGIKRFEDNDTQSRSPNARLYSSYLLQWVDYEYIQAMKGLMPDYADYFDDTEYKPLMFKADYKWHFAKAELYKHYFKVFSGQMRALPLDQNARIELVKQKIKSGIKLFGNIEEKVLLDSNSDGSHLPTWFNVLNAFQKEI